jgi:hypothetical protein
MTNYINRMLPKYKIMAADVLSRKISSFLKDDQPLKMACKQATADTGTTGCSTEIRVTPYLGQSSGKVGRSATQK